MVQRNAFWSRVFTFIPTPTTDDGEAVDLERLREVINFQIKNDVDGICVMGSTGGNGSFSVSEMKSVIEATAKHVDKRIPVLAGTGARTTSECIELSTHAENVGCDAVMVLPVSYWPLTDDEVFEHYKAVSAAISIPICVYNNPWTTGVDMKPEFLVNLAKLDNIDCVKESTGDLTRISAIRELAGDSISIIAGWESSSLQAFAVGATGWAPVLTNFLPKETMNFFRSAVYDGDLTEARSLWERLFPIADAICAKSHIRVAHSGLELLGRPVGPPRRPLRMLNAEDRSQLKQALKTAGADVG